MKTLLLPIAASMLISLPTMTLAQESLPADPTPEVSQPEQQRKYQHDHRKQKGLPSSTQSSAEEKKANHGTEKRKEGHDHQKEHK